MSAAAHDWSSPRRQTTWLARSSRTSTTPTRSAAAPRLPTTAKSSRSTCLPSSQASAARSSTSRHASLALRRRRARRRRACSICSNPRRSHSSAPLCWPRSRYVWRCWLHAGNVLTPPLTGPARHPERLTVLVQRMSLTTLDDTTLTHRMLRARMHLHIFQASERSAGLTMVIH